MCICGLLSEVANTIIIHRSVFISTKETLSSHRKVLCVRLDIDEKFLTLKDYHSFDNVPALFVEETR